jgi:DNA-directed RNA polymerase subunit RPC12/RpoP
VLGVVECEACGSNVQDIEGITDETCGFCGAKVTTES